MPRSFFEREAKSTVVDIGSRCLLTRRHDEFKLKTLTTIQKLNRGVTGKGSGYTSSGL